MNSKHLVGALCTGLFLAASGAVQAEPIIVRQENKVFYKDRIDRYSGSYIDPFYKMPLSYSFAGVTYLRSEFSSTYTILPFRGVGGDTRLNVETVAFNPLNNDIYYEQTDTVTLERDGVLSPERMITHSGTVNAEDGFSLESGNYLIGDYADYLTSELEIHQTVDHYVDTSDSWLLNTVDFFDDVSDYGVIRAIEKKGRDYFRSQHLLNQKGKDLFIKRRSDAGGVRASITTNGTSIFTASPGILAYDITFGDKGSIFLPFAFGENKDGSTLEVFFNGNLLASVNGDDYTLDELAFMTADITSFKGQSGLLEFIINTTGPNSANVYIPESFAMSAVPIPGAIWLFGSGLLGLVGVARRKKAA